MNPAPRMKRDEMLHLLELLGQRLDAKGEVGHIYVVGGAAMAFSFSRDRQTRDIDGIADPAGAVFQSVRELTDEYGLDEEWLNDAAKAFLPEVHLDSGPIVLEVPGLVVRAAPAEVILAMKILSARPQRDVEDVRFLMGLLSLTTTEELKAVFLRYYPSGELLDRSMRFIDAMVAGDDASH